MAISITIANEKGGVGKTTTAVNLAAGLALRLSQNDGPAGRGLLVDMDPQGRALLATAFGPRAVDARNGLAALLTESPPPSVQRLIQRAEHHPNLFVVPSSRPSMVEAARLLPTLMANETRLARALAPVVDQFAFIFIDPPPPTGDLLVNALVAAEQGHIQGNTTCCPAVRYPGIQNTTILVKVHFRP